MSSRALAARPCSCLDGPHPRTGDDEATRRLGVTPRRRCARPIARATHPAGRARFGARARGSTVTFPNWGMDLPVVPLGERAVGPNFLDIARRWIDRCAAARTTKWLARRVAITPGVVCCSSPLTHRRVRHAVHGNGWDAVATRRVCRCYGRMHVGGFDQRDCADDHVALDTTGLYVVHPR